MSRLKTSLPETLAATVKATIGDWQSGSKMQRLWQRDASLWTGDDEANWLGWLDITEDQIAHPVELRNCAKRSGAPDSRTCFCWAWEDQACARKFCG